MPRINRRARTRLHSLTLRQELDLLIGAGVGAFKTPADRLNAWKANREAICAMVAPLMPQACRDYEQQPEEQGEPARDIAGKGRKKQ